MKILFLAPGLERGGTGVGDYTRLLAGAVEARGARVQLLALHDPDVSGEVANKAGAHESRLPTAMPWDEKLRQALPLVPAEGWISLQFVSYGFQRKGLPFGLARWLEQLRGRCRLQIMFHELWVGGPGGRWQDRVYGWAQRWLIRSLLRRLRPQVIHTQATPYLDRLRREGWAAEQLPLMSNIRVSEAFAPGGFGAWVRKFQGPEDAPERALFCLFGSLQPQWDLAALVGRLKARLEQTGRRGWLVRVGGAGVRGEENWAAATHLQDDRLRLLATGPLAEAELSAVLQASQYGLSAMPPDLIEKSGAAAAMWEHGLPVLASRAPVFGPEMLARVAAKNPRLVSGERVDRFDEYQRAELDRTRLEGVAAQFLAALERGAM